MAVLSSGCAALGPPPPELEALLPGASAGSTRRTGRLRVESPWLGGEFRVVAIERRGAEPRVRLQLFPDVGGKLLDLVARPDGVEARWTHEDELVVERRELVGFLCVSLVEAATPLRWGRIEGGRRTADGYSLLVEPGSRGLDLELRVELDEAGEVQARHFELDGIGWTEERAPRHRFHARDFEWVFLEEREEAIPDPPDTLFELRSGSP